MDIILEVLRPYVVPIIFGICLLIGAIIKTSIPKIENRYIPLILSIIGIAVAIWINLSFTPVVLLQGLASAWASTGAYELLKNLDVTKYIAKLFIKKEE
jgi:uncharacterized membrane protein